MLSSATDGDKMGLRQWLLSVSTGGTSYLVVLWAPRGPNSGATAAALIPLHLAAGRILDTPPFFAQCRLDGTYRPDKDPEGNVTGGVPWGYASSAALVGCISRNSLFISYHRGRREPG